MKYLLPVVLALGILMGVFVKCHRSFASNRETEETQTHAEEMDSGDESYHYYDTLYRYDDKTVVAKYEDEATILTFKKNKPLHECAVKGFGIINTDGATLKMAVGVDTVCYDLKNLPDSIYPEMDLLPQGVRKYSDSYTFSFNDLSRVCEYNFDAFLPDNPPAWIRQFIATVIHNDMQGLFMDNKGSERIIKEYYGIKAKPRVINGLDASQKSPKEIAEHFANEFERLYRKEFDGDEDAPKYDYSFSIYPAWQSKDGQYVTYRFYTYYYTMGVHGYMEEYYMTFNAETGDLLSFKDFFKPGTEKRVVEEINKRYAEYKNKINKEYGITSDDSYDAGLNYELLESNASLLLKEKVGDLYYPRPAMTNEGVVFTFQPYEAGCFAEGVIHLPVRYSRLKPVLAVTP